MWIKERMCNKIWFSTFLRWWIKPKRIMFESNLKCYPYASQFYIPSMIFRSWISGFIFIMSNLSLKACVVGLKWHQGSWWITFIQGYRFCGEIWNCCCVGWIGWTQCIKLCWPWHLIWQVTNVCFPNSLMILVTIIL